jgi:hypothetical protein
MEQQVILYSDPFFTELIPTEYLGFSLTIHTYATAIDLHALHDFWKICHIQHE